MILQGKKVLLIYQPWGWGENENSLVFPMVSELQLMGAQVMFLNIKNPPVLKKRIIDKIKNFINRKFFKKEDYYYYEEIKQQGDFYKKQLLNLEKCKYDYTLIIRPDNFSLKFIKVVRSMSDIMVGYMWDGIKIKQSIHLKKCRKLYDDLLSFNKDDIRKFPELMLSFTTNFYYSSRVYRCLKPTEITYIGSIFINRKDVISFNFCNAVTDNFNIIIFLDYGYLCENEMISDERIKYIYTHIPYLKTLQFTQNSKVILDICRDDHKGLSFRFFESMQMEKKIITNNRDVINYDFYSPQNILVLDSFETFDIEKVKDFIEIPYQKLNFKMVNYYSFTNWFIRNFNI